MPSVTPRDLTGKSPLFVSLSGSDERLPGGEYIRVVSHCMGPDRKVIRSDFALHNRGARLCRLLDSILDSVDVDLKNKPDPIMGPIPTVSLPQATRGGCECVFRYLDLIQTRIPTLLSKPLRAPLEELVFDWEMAFLIQDCLPLINPQYPKTSAALSKKLSKSGPQSLDRLLEVAMLADFLLIDPLRDLTCSFLASIALTSESPREMLQLCGLDHPLTEEELEPLYMQLPFLRTDEP